MYACVLMEAVKRNSLSSQALVIAQKTSFFTPGRLVLQLCIDWLGFKIITLPGI